MKKGFSLLGLPVISIKEGKEVGRVIDLLVAPKGLKLEFLLVGRQSKYIDLRLLAFSQVVGLGQYAVTVETEAQLQQIEAVPAVRDCLEASVDIMDKMVLTRSGNLEGLIADLFFDETDKVIQKIAEGKLTKWYSSVALLEQEFVKEPEKTIDDLRRQLVGLIGENVEIRRFARFRVGDEVA